MFVRRALLIAPLFVATFLGCSSAPKVDTVDHFGQIVTKLGVAQTDLDLVSQAVDGVLLELGTLASAATAEGDLRQPLSSLGGSLDALGQAVNTVRSAGKNIRAQEAAYEAAWELSIQGVVDPNLRRTAEKGHASIAATFARLDEMSASLNASFDAWVAKMRGIESALDTNLSQATLTSLAPDIESGGTEGKALSDQIRAMKWELAKTSSSLTEVDVPAPAAAPVADPAPGA